MAKESMSDIREIEEGFGLHYLKIALRLVLPAYGLVPA